jgi:two-component system, sensor histidine kinase and response regulator
LNEIRLDLAVGFPNEFNAPLSTISDNIDRLKQNIGQLSSVDTLQLLELSERSVTRLHTLTQKFWFYLKLMIDTPTPNHHDLSMPTVIIDQLLTDRFKGLPLPVNLVCEIEDTKLAVDVDLTEWIFNELLEHVFDHCDANIGLKIHGETIDNIFHLSLSSLQENKPKISNSDISNLIQFNSAADENPELAIGLKIVKKIVEIYDGIFLMSSADQNEMTFYLTLPLVSFSYAGDTPLTAALNNNKVDEMCKSEQAV